MSVVINILAAIGLIVIIAYAVYQLYNYLSQIQLQKSITEINPPGSYMQSTGVLCPDYWINSGVDKDGNYICTNPFSIQTGTTANRCNTDQVAFTPIPTGYTWDYNNANGLKSMTDNDKYSFLTTTKTGGPISRCDWVNKCGPSATVQGIWTGVNDICNSPPISS